MRGHHCEKDVGTKVAAFTNFIETTNPNQETPTFTTENVELLTKFATFLQQQKHEKHMHGDKHHWHGKFGKHGHHGMFGHHFGRHGPYGKHEHGHGKHGHGHGKHGHGHGHHGHHGKHGFECGNYFEHEHFGKHHKMGKHYWKHVAMFNKANPDRTIVIEDGECGDTGRNPSPPRQVNDTVAQVLEGSSEVNNAKCMCERKDRHCGRRWRGHEWVVISRSAVDEGSSQNQTTQPPQDSLATMVENISIENSPPKE